MKKFVFVSCICLFFYFSVDAAEPVDLFPGIDGWDLQIESIVYTPDNLWELINGAADVFLLYHFQDLHIGEYSNQSNSSVRVELYRHSNSDNTFGIYTSERMPDYNFFEIGTEGYTSFGVLNFFTGDYYVKMFWSGAGDADEAKMQEIAGKIEYSLKQPKGWPEEISLFPAENRVEKSEGYSSENFMGYSFLNAAFTVTYKTDDKEYKMFLIEQKNPEEAKATLEKYFKVIKFNYTAVEEKSYQAEDPYNGKVGIGVKGNFIYGIIQAEDEKIIEENLVRLSEKIVRQ